MPRSPRPAAPRGLFFRQHHGAFRLACMPQFQRHAIRRIRLEKMVDALPEKAALQPLPQHVRRKNIGRLFQEVSSGGLAFHLHAQSAQTLYPAPHRRSRNTNLFRNPRAADHDRGIFREQRHQACQPTVGCSGENILSHRDEARPRAALAYVSWLPSTSGLIQNSFPAAPIVLAISASRRAARRASLPVL